MYILSACTQPLMNQSIATYIEFCRPHWIVMDEASAIFAGHQYDAIITDRHKYSRHRACIQIEEESLRAIVKKIENVARAAPSSAHSKVTIGVLSKREVEVLMQLYKGDSNKEIAHTLGLQVTTIKLHVRGICKKLGAKNRTQAVLIAGRLSLH